MRVILMLSAVFAAAAFAQDEAPEPVADAAFTAPEPAATELAAAEAAAAPAVAELVAAEPDAAELVAAESATGESGVEVVPGQGNRTMLGMSILGNEEAPKSLVIVPWKSSRIGDGLGVTNSMDGRPSPVDREVFMREVRYYELRAGGAQ